MWDSPRWGTGLYLNWGFPAVFSTLFFPGVWGSAPGLLTWCFQSSGIISLLGKYVCSRVTHLWTPLSSHRKGSWSLWVQGCSESMWARLGLLLARCLIGPQSPTLCRFIHVPSPVGGTENYLESEKPKEFYSSCVFSHCLEWYFYERGLCLE